MTGVQTVSLRTTSEPAPIAWSTRCAPFGANVLIFSSGHILRVIAARWLGLGPEAARYLVLNTASVSALGYEHDLTEPVIRLWNDTHHVSA